MREEILKKKYKNVKNPYLSTKKAQK